MDRLDIAIAGCGVAGLASALLLHRQGHEVTLYERFPEPQPIGSGLMIQPTGLAVLAHLGLAQAAVAKGSQIERLHGLNQLGEAVLEADYRHLEIAGLFGLGIHRGSLFELLYQAVIDAGIEVRTSHEIARSESCAKGRRLHFTDHAASIEHQLLVDCLGVGSPLVPAGDSYLPFGALWCTLEWPEDGPFNASLLEQRYEHAGKMVGVLPTGRRTEGGPREFSFFWSLQQAAYAPWQEQGLERWKDEVFALWPECAGILEQIAAPEQLTFACYAHRSWHSPVEQDLIHIGDAWHSASPQLGQGANMALLDAWALASALAGEGELQQRLHRAIALRRGHVRLYQWLTAAFTPLYQSQVKLPAVLRDVLLAPLSRIPPGPAAKAMLVAGLAGSPLSKLQLDMPDYEALAAIPSSIATRASSLAQS